MQYGRTKLSLFKYIRFDLGSLEIGEVKDECVILKIELVCSIYIPCLEEEARLLKLKNQIYQMRWVEDLGAAKQLCHSEKSHV